MKTVDAVGLLILKNGRLLVEKRRMDKATDPGLLSIPGGHVELGESHFEACKRELKEELNLDCTQYSFITKKLWKTPIEYQLIHYYLCENWSGELRCNEAEKVFYIKTSDLNLLDIEMERDVVREMIASIL